MALFNLSGYGSSSGEDEGEESPEEMNTCDSGDIDIIKSDILGKRNKEIEPPRLIPFTNDEKRSKMGPPNAISYITQEKIKLPSAVSLMGNSHLSKSQSSSYLSFNTMSKGPTPMNPTQSDNNRISVTSLSSSIHNKVVNKPVNSSKIFKPPQLARPNVVTEDYRTWGAGSK